MKKVGFVLASIAGVFALVITLGLIYLTINFPKDIQVETLTLPTDSLRIANGKYLANHVMVCTDCHSKRDMSVYSGRLPESGFGGGGRPFSREMNFPGEIYPGNLTPTAKASWTNEELYKAITIGIHKEGHALFPIMPYMNYRTLDKDDILDVIAYLRTLEPRENNFDSKPQDLDFPLNLIVKTMPQETAHQRRPEPSDKVAYGKYLFTAASCMECHTPQDKGQFILEKMLAGGREFIMPNGKISVSANITPDEKTGIGSWTEEQFVSRFKSYADTVITLGKNDFNTEMPWSMYAGMKEDDLKAIYAYLRTVKPVENAIVKFK